MLTFKEELSRCIKQPLYYTYYSFITLQSKQFFCFSIDTLVSSAQSDVRTCGLRVIGENERLKMMYPEFFPSGL